MCDISVDDKACTSTGLQPLYYHGSTRSMVLGPTGGCPPCRMIFDASFLPPGRALTDDTTSIVWTNWTTKPTTTYTQVNAGNGAVGTIALPSGVVTVSVLYAGFADPIWGNPDWIPAFYATLTGYPHIFPNSSNFIQSTWGQMSAYGLPQTVNMPVTSTFTFSEPVCNPIFTFISIGSNAINATPKTTVRITCSAPYSILYQPTPGQNPLDPVDCYTFAGTESAGIIQFMGTFSEISFTPDNTELSSQYTLGVPVYAPGSNMCNPQDFDTFTDITGRTIQYINGQWKSCIASALVGPTGGAARATPCDVVVNEFGSVFQPIGTGYKYVTTFCTDCSKTTTPAPSEPCVAPGASLPAGAAQVGYDCARLG